jgi:hypothetical protein
LFAALVAILLPLGISSTTSPLPRSYPPDVVASVVIHDIVGYASAVALQEGVAYVAALQATEAAQEAQRATQGVSRPVTAPVTGACGGATNGADQYIARESGGNPNAYNPSGAWGCYQIMPGTWAGAGCDELGAYGSASPAAQSACASRLPLSAWAL